jgi:hypothetical protein
MLAEVVYQVVARKYTVNSTMVQTLRWSNDLECELSEKGREDCREKGFLGLWQLVVLTSRDSDTTTPAIKDRKVTVPNNSLHFSGMGERRR